MRLINFLRREEITKWDAISQKSSLNLIYIDYRFRMILGWDNAFI